MDSKIAFHFLGITFSTDNSLTGNTIFGTLFVLYLISVIWGVRDAIRRHKNGFLAWFFLTAAAWPISLLFWLWVRPPTEEERQAKVARDSSGDCPRCGTRIADRSDCPNCHWTPTEA